MPTTKEELFRVYGVDDRNLDPEEEELLELIAQYKSEKKSAFADAGKKKSERSWKEQNPEEKGDSVQLDGKIQHQTYNFTCGHQTEYVNTYKADIKSSLNLSVKQLMNHNCSFHAEFFSREIKTSNSDSTVSVYENILRRGAPTFCSLLVEESLSKIPYLPVPINKEIRSGSIHYRANENEKQNEWLDALARALVLIDPRLTETHFSSFDSDEEKEFLSNVVPNYFGKHILQLFEPQREIGTIGQSQGFSEQRVDFAIDVPDSTKPFFGAVIEVDGSQHEEEKQKRLDLQRDSFIKENGFGVARITASEVKSGKFEKLDTLKKQFSEATYLNIAEKNFVEPLYESETGKAALQYTLTPLMVARFQYTLLHLIKSHVLDIKKKEWSISVFERDIPFAFLAMQDFLDFLENMYKLQGEEFGVKKINLEVYYTPEFGEFFDFSVEQDERINYKRISIERYENFDGTLDVFVDASILQRIGLTDTPKKIFKNTISEGASVARLRSAFREISTRRVSSNYPIEYKVAINNHDSLTFFLQNLFRKETFRDGQVEIISRALAKKDVIGLLPTGAGKSICYQLAVLLQPGVSLVIDPLRSLMLDQADNLREIGIDMIEFITSEGGVKERKRVMKNLSIGKLLFVFVSPERLQIQIFRDSLRMLTSERLISYVVIDEAHCVSEWGHDFRTSYLNIGRIAKEYCKFKGVPPITIALTGTASPAVLNDVKREIDIVEEGSVIRPTSFDRKELHFEVVEVPSAAKSIKLKEVIEDIAAKFKIDKEVLFADLLEDSYSGLIFCPHVNGTFGVVELSSFLQNEFGVDAGFYSGKKPQFGDIMLDGSAWDGMKRKTQRDFKNNKFPLLVSTKAFGRGIDKPNIRYTVHYGIPQSLEAYYQEAGRAGRNRKDAYCWIILSDDSKENADEMLNADSVDELKEIKEPSRKERGDIHRNIWFHKNSFKGISNEITNIKSIHRTLIKPLVEEISEEGAYATKSIPFSFLFEQELSEKGNSQQDTEKAIYRLMLLGIIKDYTVDYHAKEFETLVQKINEEEVVENLISYVRKYQTNEYCQLIPSMLDELNGSTTQRCIKFLINFVYNEIEKKRRRAISEMADAARNFTDGENFRSRIVNYFDSKYSDLLEDLATDFNPDDWWELLDKVSNYDDIQHLFGGVPRVLESYPDHAGLLLLSSFARIATPDYSDDMALTDFEKAIKVIQKFRPDLEEQEEILYKFIQYVYKQQPGKTFKLLNILFPYGDYKKIAEFTLNAPDLKEAQLSASTVFMRDIKRHIKAVNETFAKVGE